MSLHSVTDISSLGTILFVGAHPDDETFLCGGILAAAAANGQRVICVTATRGEEGVQNEARWPRATLGEVRTKELEQSLQILGITEHYWLAGYRDGACAAADQSKAIDTIAARITACNPDTVLTFGPDGLSGHPDHQAVSRWTTEALKKTGSHAKLFYKVEVDEIYKKYLKPMDDATNMYFMIDKPPLKLAAECDICIELSPELCERKLQALYAQASQTESLSRFPEEFLRAAFGYEAFVRASPESV